MKLTPEERKFLLQVVKPYREYYTGLRIHPLCSKQNLEKATFFEILYKKLHESRIQKTD